MGNVNRVAWILVLCLGLVAGLGISAATCEAQTCPVTGCTGGGDGCTDCEECCDGYWDWVCYDNDGVPGFQVPNEGWNGEPAAPGGDWDWCEDVCVSYCFDCAGDPTFVQRDRRELSKLRDALAKRLQEKAARGKAGASASVRTS